ISRFLSRDTSMRTSESTRTVISQRVYPTGFHGGDDGCTWPYPGFVNHPGGCRPTPTLPFGAALACRGNARGRPLEPALKLWSLAFARGYGARSKDCRLDRAVSAARCILYITHGSYSFPAPPKDSRSGCRNRENPRHCVWREPPHAAVR